MKTWRAAAFLVLGLCSVSTLVGDEPNQTFGLLNGRAWQNMRAAQRLAYLSGLFDGLNYYGTHIEFRTDRANVGFNGPEIAQGVTDFYAKDSARLRLPIPTAVTLFFRHAEGDSDVRIRKRVQELLRQMESAKVAHPRR